MSSSSLASILIIFFALALVHAREGHSPPRINYEVHILNGFQGGPPINGTCTFLGEFTINNPGEQFFWSFAIKFHSRTIFRCYVRRGDKHRNFIAFDQATDSHVRRCGRTGDCWWKLTRAGLYWGNDNVTWTKELSWDK